MPGSPTSYGNLSFKGSHNSYQRKEDLHVQIAFDNAAPAQGGCRALEIDIVRHSDSSGGATASYFQVSHDQGGSGDPLAAWLGYLLSFHLNDTRHDPIFLTLDVKSQGGDVSVFPEELDTYIRNWFAANLLFTPADVVETSGLDLLPFVSQNGWPELSSLAGRFIFCVSGTKRWKSTYANSRPTLGRLCFADFDIDDKATTWSAPAEGTRAVANLNLFSDHHGTWSGTVPEMRQAGLLVRGYVLDSATLWSNAQAAGVNILATDEITGKSWAHVGVTPFV